jgi:hypothetical protein
LSEECLVLDLAEPLAGPFVERVVEIDNEGLPVEPGESIADRWRELPVGDQDLRLTMARM